MYKVIQRNGFFAHPESILLAMLNDDDLSVRELALEKIRAAREERMIDGTNAVRLFKAPSLTFNANNYTDLVDWTTGVTEPPLLRGVSDSNLCDFIHERTDIGMDFQKYPCHTQAVERCVELVTKAS